MKIAILGSGGREHAISFAISKSKKVKKVYCIPGNAGTSQIATNVDLDINQFENLYKNLGDVSNGFPKQIPLESLTNRAEFNPEMLRENLMFGTPDTIIKKLKQYEELGVDEFIYYASMGLGLKEQKKSLELFCSEVMPAFQ